MFDSVTAVWDVDTLKTRSRIYHCIVINSWHCQLSSQKDIWIWILLILLAHWECSRLFALTHYINYLLTYSLVGHKWENDKWEAQTYRTDQITTSVYLLVDAFVNKSVNKRCNMFNSSSLLVIVSSLFRHERHDWLACEVNVKPWKSTLNSVLITRYHIFIIII